MMDQLTAAATHEHAKLATADVAIRKVNVSYGSNHVLKDVDLDIHAGEFFAFLGPSGCGKTTLLRLIAGFNAATSGEVRIGGADVSNLPPWKRDVGMVFQSYALWPHMTVAQNVAFGLEERRLPRPEIKARVATALGMVGLSHLAERRPSQLSGGQQQRVAVARTIAIQPKVLLLDEPLSNLDAQMRVQVRRELRDLQQRLGITTIFVTHDQEEANTICDRIAVMKDGIVQQVGAPMEVYEHPVNLFVASFLGTANIIEGRVVPDGGRRVFEMGGALRLPVPDGAVVPDDARLVFRPQHAGLSAPHPARPALPGVVKHREFLGATVRYEVEVGASSVVVDAPFQTGADLYAPGDAVGVTLPLSSIHWLAE
ncbi:MAG: ABC transporter ATP-binding protein [Beijerinckiaceae bacterium]|nr:ABC transporter ATP-binding protein [Beijerinckiaceae bacterium]